MARRVAFGVVRTAGAADDPAHHAGGTAFAPRAPFRRGAKFSTWLTRIVINECLMQLRYKRRISTISIDSAPQEVAHLPFASGGCSPETAVARVSVARLLEREVRRIPPLLRHAFVLCVIQEKPMTEVACRLGISVEAAKGRLSRARQELRRRLEPHLTTRRHYSQFKFSTDKKKERAV
jgi:RNA polymerase sigma-70 factor (ECF subfamily)